MSTMILKVSYDYKQSILVMFYNQLITITSSHSLDTEDDTLLSKIISSGTSLKPCSFKDVNVFCNLCYKNLLAGSQTNHYKTIKLPYFDTALFLPSNYLVKFTSLRLTHIKNTNKRFYKIWACMVTQKCNPSTQEAKTEGSQVQGQPWALQDFI